MDDTSIIATVGRIPFELVILPAEQIPAGHSWHVNLGDSRIEISERAKASAIPQAIENAREILAGERAA